MVKKRNLLLLLLLTIIAIGAISSADASELDSDDIQASADEMAIGQEEIESIAIDESNFDDNALSQSGNNANDDLLNQNDGNDILTADSKTFKDLNDLINGNDDASITLEDDYQFDSSIDGDYQYGIVISRTLTIDGNGHTINGSSLAKAFNVTASNVVFKNIKFSNLRKDYWLNGGAIYSASEDLNTKAIGCEFFKCIGNYGGAICNVSSYDCTFYNNSANYGGAQKGGLSVNCTFKYNRANSGGALYDVCIANSTISENTASSFGGGLYGAHDKQYEALNCVFYKNTAGSGGAFYTSWDFYGNYNCSLSNCTFENNSARYEGGAVHCGSVRFGIFINNTCSNHYSYKDSYSAQVGGARGNRDNITVYYPNPFEYYVDLYCTTNNFGTVHFYGINVTMNLYANNGPYAGPFNTTTGSTVTQVVNPGNYSVSFVIKDEPYSSSSQYFSGGYILVKGLQTSIEADDVEAFYKEGTVTAKLCDNNGQAVANCDLNLSVGDLIIPAKTNGAGVAEFDLGDLARGSYNATISFAGNNIYADCNKTINVNVKQIDTEIVADDIEFVYDESGSLTATLKQLDGTLLKDFDLRVVIGSIIDETIKTDSNGQIKLDLTGKFEMGTYDGEIYFGGTNRLVKSETAFKVLVSRLPPVITASDLTCTYEDGTELTVTLKDKYGNLIPDAKLTFKAPGKTFTETTDANGQVKFPVSILAAKTNQATITYDGDDVNSKMTKTVSITVKQISAGLNTKLSVPSITTKYNVAKNLVISLKDANGKAVKNARLIVNFNGKEQVLTTDSKGQAKLSSYNLIPKTYNVEINYDGVLHKYLPTAFSAKIVVSKALPKILAKNKSYKKGVKTKKYTVTLKNNVGKIMKNTKLTLKVKGKTYSAKTNSKGVATFKISNLNKKGKFKALIKSTADKYYKAKSKTVYISVK